MKIKKKFKYIFLALIVMAISYNAFENDSELEVNASGLSEQEILANVDALKRLEAAETSAIEEKIQAVQLEISKSEEEKSLQVKSHKNGFRKAFESVVFMGDSQAEPLSLYGYVDSSSVVASKGRNVISAKDDVKKAASLSPQKIVMLYGVNDLLLFKTTEDFISHYRALIESVRIEIPRAEIYVNSVYPVKESVIEKKPLFKRSGDFNEALVSMCSDMGITYIDSTHLIKENPDYYAADGIHFKAQYYPAWLDFLMAQIGIQEKK